MPSNEYGYDEEHVVTENEYHGILQTNTRLRPRPDLASEYTQNVNVEDVKLEVGHENVSSSLNEVLMVSRSCSGLKELDKSNTELIRV